MSDTLGNLLDHLAKTKQHWLDEKRKASVVPLLETFYDGRIAQIDDLATWLVQEHQRETQVAHA